MEYILIGVLVLGLGFYLYKEKWEKGMLLKRSVKAWSIKPLHDWDASFLASKRNVQDPLADEVIKTLFASDNVSDINSFYQSIQRTVRDLPDDLPDYLRAYFDDNSALPPWANKQMIRKAQQFYIRHGPIISMVLCAKSLPECYACANGAMVLYKTGRLSEKNGSMEYFTRRIAETAQFIVNAMAPRGLSPVGMGIRSAQKVRLIHASIRYYLHQDGWDTEQYGQPINQEDLAGTLMSFAPLVLEGLETLGVKVSDEEKEAYFHAWRVIGYFMGIDDDLLPNNVEDSFALGYSIFNKEKAASDHGVELTEALMSFMTRMSDDGIMNHVVDDLLRLMLGDETADMLGIPPRSHEKKIEIDRSEREPLEGWEDFKNRHEILQKLRNPISKRLLNGMLVHLNQGEKINFFIPPSLQEDWDVS